MTNNKTNDNMKKMALITHYPLNEHHAMFNGKDEMTTVNGDSNNITIVTLFTDKDKAMLASQLEKNNIGYINAAENVDYFVKAFKPIYYNDALDDVKTEYVLLMDAYDTVVTSFDGMSGVPIYYGKKLVYSAWKYHFPTYFDVDFGVSEDNQLKYLNSGVVFGKTSDVKSFYNLLSEYIQQNYVETDSDEKDYEQYWIYRFLKENKTIAENVGIDYDEKLVTSMPFDNN